jgi:hypothetical protein
MSVILRPLARKAQRSADERGAIRRSANSTRPDTPLARLIGVPVNHVDRNLVQINSL